ncbi:MAG: hypothetical protein M1829_001365 [Trizodia sp. TS-e1964]|nr:MAG: hypothetical protein M1829_001365 [Trizodia sp. TS-e1964]
MAQSQRSVTPFPSPAPTSLPSSDFDGEAIGPFPALPARPTAVMNVLRALPRLRNAETRPNQALNLRPNANVKAVMIQMVGTVAKTLCHHCSKRFGKFVECVAVAG